MTQTAVDPTEAGHPEAASPPGGAERARTIPGSRIWGWVGPLLVGGIAAALRFIDLGRPNKIIFDETYYAKDAFSLLEHGYARAFVEDADKMILNGNLDVFTDEPSFVVHPPLGKWLIALGIRLIGMEPMGWRLATAAAGVITVILLARAGRRLFRSTLLGCTAGLLLAVEGISITVNRTAILDGILTMFIVAAFACLLVDRDHVRERFRSWTAERSDTALGDGPVFGWRPWRLSAGILLGMACATKWSGVYVVAVFGVMAVLWDVGARRAAGLRSPTLNALLRDGPVAFVTIVVSALAVYLASWTGWIRADDSWGRTWAADHPASGLAAQLPDWLRSLWHYHDQILAFHTGLTDDHDYASRAWTWMIMQRPVSFDYTSYERGEASCTAAKCSQEVLALGTPILWWAGCLAVLACVWWWFVHRDWRPGAILAGLLATWVPWLAFPDRTMFAFYAAAIAPFVVLAVTYCLGRILGSPQASPTRRTVGAAVAGAFVLAVVVVAAWFYPIHVDQVIPHRDWDDRMWFDSWI